jgi:hypothetical protein
MSWRDEAAERLERMCGLNPEALGTGPIDRTAMPWWRNRARTIEEGYTWLPSPHNASKVVLHKWNSETGQWDQTPFARFMPLE